MTQQNFNKFVNYAARITVSDERWGGEGSWPTLK